MTAASTLDLHLSTLGTPSLPLAISELGRRTDPLLPGPAFPSARLRHACQPPSVKSTSRKRASDASRAADPTVDCLRAQLPAFAPLLEELEIAGWSSARSTQRGNFHDWMFLGSDRLLVLVGHAAGPDSRDPTEPALVAQAAWAAIRAHAVHTRDAGTLLSLAGQSLWPTPAARVHAHVAVAMIDTLGGHATLAIAGDCLAWKIRAATSEQFALRQPALGAACDFTYLAHSVELSLRERLILVADNPHHRPPKLAATIASTFARLDAETHRRMLATDAVTLLRHHYEQTPTDQRLPVSIAAVRRR